MILLIIGYKTRGMWGGFYAKYVLSIPGNSDDTYSIYHFLFSEYTPALLDRRKGLCRIQASSYRIQYRP